MKRITLALMVLLFVHSLLSVAAEYHVDREAKNSVIFLSKAPLEDFEGKTDRIDGYVKWDGDPFPPDQTRLAESELYFEVELASIDTGIGMRNRDMREDYLETKKYPYAKFTAHLTQAQKVSDTLYTATAVGKFYIHGVDKEMTIPTTIISKNGAARVLCNFEVKLPDFKIKIPKLMFLKVNEVIKLKLDFNLKPIKDSK